MFKLCTSAFLLNFLKFSETSGSKWSVKSLVSGSMLNHTVDFLQDKSKTWNCVCPCHERIQWE